MLEVQHTNATAPNLVFVRWTDPPPRRSDRFARGALRVHELVIRHNEVRTIADVEAPLHVHAVLYQLVDLSKKRLGIEHDAIPNRAAHTGLQDPAWDLMQYEGTLAKIDGVTSVRPP